MSKATVNTFRASLILGTGGWKYLMEVLTDVSGSSIQENVKGEFDFDEFFSELWPLENI